jgi:periplasmic protein CpxP/Spy
MKQRLYIIALALIMLCAATLQAQKPPRMSPEERAKQLKEKLQLSDEQTQKVAAILKESREEMKAAKAENDKAKEQVKDQKKEMRKDEMKKVDAKIKAVLTKEQLAKFEKMEKQMHKKMMKEKQEKKDMPKDKPQE